MLFIPITQVFPQILQLPYQNMRWGSELQGLQAFFNHIFTAQVTQPHCLKLKQPCRGALKFSWFPINVNSRFPNICITSLQMENLYRHPIYQGTLSPSLNYHNSTKSMLKYLYLPISNGFYSTCIYHYQHQLSGQFSHLINIKKFQITKTVCDSYGVW